PLRIILGEGNALALHGVADDRARLLSVERQAAEHGLQRGDVVAVDIDRRKAKGLPLVDQRLEVLDVLGEARGLDLAVVDDRGEVREPMLAGAERRLPDRALVDLAITHDDEDAAVALLHARGERHPDADRQSVAKRAGRGLDAWNLAALRMAAEDAVDAAEGVELFGLDETLVGEQRVEREAAVALAEDAAVALGPVRPRGVVAHHVVVEDAQDLDQRH